MSTNINASNASNASPFPPPKSAIYTRTGDKGTTGLYGGQRISKASLIIEALGNNDELTSSIGIAREYSNESLIPLHDHLHQIQCVIQDLNSHISSSGKISFEATHTINLENWIDQYDAKLPKLTKFILPSGGFLASHLHMSRSICRRAERSLYSLLESKQSIHPSSVQYLNRLSDCLFVMARWSCISKGDAKLERSK